MKYYRSLIGIASLFLMLVLVAACGGGESAGTEPSKAPAESGASAAPGATGASTGGDAAKGEQVFTELGCSGCHSISGQAGAGPALNGIAGTEVKLESGETVTIDDAYLHESILEPDAKVVEGFSSGVMSGATAGSQDKIKSNVDALVAYIKSLK